MYISNTHKINADILNVADTKKSVVVLNPDEENDFYVQFKEAKLPEKFMEQVSHIVTTILSVESESEILKNAEPSQTDHLLRVSFWEEISNALAEAREFSFARVYNGICSHVYMNSLKKDEWRFAYLLTPIKNYEKMNKVLLHLGQTVIFDILNTSPYIQTKRGKVLDSRIAKVQLEAYKMIDERIHGKSIARLQSHSVNETISSEPTTIDVDVIKKQIKDLEKELIE